MAGFGTGGGDLHAWLHVSTYFTYGWSIWRLCQELRKYKIGRKDGQENNELERIWNEALVSSLNGGTEENYGNLRHNSRRVILLSIRIS